MAAETKTTTDHTTIKKWAEARGGKPASVKRTASDQDVGLLRIDFPGYSGADSLEAITWEEFFAKFDEKKLAFLYQDHISSGEESRFFKLVSRETAEHKAESASHSRKTDASAHKDEAKTTTPKSDEKSHKDEAKASTHKSDEKSRKSEAKASTHKGDEKPHKDEAKASTHKSDEKSHKAEAKSDEKGHKASHK